MAKNTASGKAAPQVPSLASAKPKAKPKAKPQEPDPPQVPPVPPVFPSFTNPLNATLKSTLATKTQGRLQNWNPKVRNDADRRIQNQEGLLGLYTREIRERELYDSLIQNGDVDDTVPPEEPKEAEEEKKEAEEENNDPPASNDKDDDDEIEPEAEEPPKKKRRVCKETYGSTPGHQKWTRPENSACELGVNVVRETDRYEEMKLSKCGISNEFATEVHHEMYNNKISPLYRLPKNQQRSIKQVRNKLARGGQVENKQHANSLYSLLADVAADLKGTPEGIDTDAEALTAATTEISEEKFVSSVSYRLKQEKKKREAIEKNQSPSEIGKLSDAVSALVQLEAERVKQNNQSNKPVPEQVTNPDSTEVLMVLSSRLVELQEAGVVSEEDAAIISAVLIAGKPIQQQWVSNYAQDQAKTCGITIKELQVGDLKKVIAIAKCAMKVK